MLNEIETLQRKQVMKTKIFTNKGFITVTRVVYYLISAYRWQKLRGIKKYKITDVKIKYEKGTSWVCSKIFLNHD